MRKKIGSLAISIVFLCIIAGTSMFYSAKSVYAFTPNYDPTNIIDNPTLTDTTTMTAGEIQTFLSNLNSGIASYTAVEACDSTIAPYYSHCGQTISAAQIIYDASQAYGINPRAILATMEKEQSLVTDPNPSSSQINCAMGYNSCSTYVGFFTQVDNGTWVLRYNYEGAFKHSTWLSWHPAAGYPCAAADTTTNLYNNGLYPGNTVTFSDPYYTNDPVGPGQGARTITLANTATASFYCYTPYVGPFSATGYSGSYNFVYYFQLWFGSTQTSVPYAWDYDTQAAYSDQSMTKPLTGVPTVGPGGLVYAQVKARNVGYQTWSQSYLHLGTSHPNDRSSVFYDNSWLGAARPAGMVETSVVPGDEGIFNFILHAPQQTGTYREYFNLVDDGTTWLNDPGLYFQINVVDPLTTSPNSSDTTMASGQTITPGQYIISPDNQNVLVLQKDGNLVQYNNFDSVWSSGTSGYSAALLAMQADGNLVLYDKNMKPLWDSGTQNNSGAWLNLQPDGNLVIYSKSNQPLWSTASLSNTVIGNPDNLSYVNTTMPDAYLFAGQSLFTADRNYRLVLQADGNLVLYDKNMKPLWDSGTSGIPVEFLALQPDGNLVLYGLNNNPIWYTSTTGHPDDHLTIQQDGNLVLYSRDNLPLWNTATNGLQ